MPEITVAFFYATTSGYLGLNSGQEFFKTATVVADARHKYRRNKQGIKKDCRFGQSCYTIGAVD